MRLLFPAARFERPWQIAPSWLHARGLKGLLLDLDNTLIPYGYEGPAPEPLRAWLDELKRSGIAACLVTNAKPGRTRRWARKLGLPGIALVGKPLPFGFVWGMKQLGLKRSELAVVGDQIFTDVLGGNLLGLTTILVAPLSDRGLPHTRWVRTLERRVLKAASPPEKGESE